MCHTVLTFNALLCLSSFTKASWFQIFLELFLVFSHLDHIHIIPHKPPPVLSSPRWQNF